MPDKKLPTENEVHGVIDAVSRHQDNGQGARMSQTTLNTILGLLQTLLELIKERKATSADKASSAAAKEPKK